MIQFNQPYNREEFTNFLRRDFLPDDFEQEESSISFATQTKYSKQATKLGVCKSLDLVVYEINHCGKDDPRVGLSKESFRLLAEEWQNRALIIFVPEDSFANYRFSLIEIKLEGQKDSSKLEHKYSNPRRYSYLLGVGIGGHTPNEYLLSKGKIRERKEGNKNLSSWEDLLSRFSVEILTKAFYAELSDWYAWAIDTVTFPGEQAIEDKDKRNEHRSKNVIRLLTRLLFVWFLKQKRLIPDELFDEEYLKNNILRDFDPNLQTGLFKEKSKDSVYYKAILQNLFFATLNCPIVPQSVEDQRERGFRKSDWYGQGFGYDYLMRYESLFSDPAKFLALVNECVPFLNGGLFDCLDDKQNKIYIDGFSDNLPKPNQLIVPDYLFFGEVGKGQDLSDFYGDKKKKSTDVYALLDILKKYNFTIEENTPFDQDVSLDPELLGKVFENLLASYNPETKTTARKQTGSFYTPREIVQYMVDESLVAHLKRTVGDEYEQEYRKLIQYTDEPTSLNDEQKRNIIQSLQNCKVLDPACGSGAFPVGVLQQMVHILSQIDPKNETWKDLILENSIRELGTTLKDCTPEERDEIQDDINRNFDDSINRPDYARKLYLIENCIYGVDIQPIAIQISKLRFFISLVVDQKPTTDANTNFGIRPLPNLEAKFVAANTLIGLNKGERNLFDNLDVEKLQDKLIQASHRIFGAKSNKTKNKYKAKVEELQNEIATKLLENGDVGNDDARLMREWRMFDQNASSPFFDPEWMFGVSGGFDIVIANPPYIDSETMVLLGLEHQRKYIVDNYSYICGNWDIYMAFFEKGLNLSSGCLCYITPDKWLSKPFGKKFRKECMTAKLNTIVHAGSKIFESATVDAIITKFIPKSLKITAYTYNANKQLVERNSVDNSTLKQPYLIDSLFSENNSLIDIIEQRKCICISDIAECENACATNDAYKLSPLVKDGNWSSNYYKLINTGTICKYSTKWGVSEITYLGAKVLYPIVCKTEFETTFGKSYTRKAKCKKLIFKGLNLLDVFIDYNCEYLPGKTTLVICNDNNTNLELLCGILNSKIAIFYIKTKYSSSSYCGGITFTKDMINSFPLPKCREDFIMYFTNKVRCVINEKILGNDTSALENEIDFLVYKLYGLTYDEVLIIDPQTTITKQQYEQ